jgi:hypothetical protein
MIQTFAARAIKDKAEFQEVFNLSQSTYGNMNISFATATDWWITYSEAVYVLLKDDDLVGYLTALPLTRFAFNDLVENKLQEQDICPSDILGNSYNGLRSHWYIASLEIQAQYRKTSAVFFLLKQALFRIHNYGKLSRVGKVCALAYSRQGEVLLKYFGFYCDRRQDPPSPNSLPVYVRVFSLEELSLILQSL